ncbi:hypothetical protein LY76DRAFT_650561 [Colletotrichum caudatum]|nr:hypothetical protein LY76DRAFT_650561 [Colletotrichum caudatum]
MHGKRARVTWRPSDKGLMKGFLAHYRLCEHELKALSRMSAIRGRPPGGGGGGGGQGGRSPSPPLQPPSTPVPADPDLHVLAEYMNIDTTLLLDDAWGAIRDKMVSCMTYTLDKNISAGILSVRWNPDKGYNIIDWPDQVRDAWTHEGWWGDDDAVVEAVEEDGRDGHDENESRGDAAGDAPEQQLGSPGNAGIQQPPQPARPRTPPPPPPPPPVVRPTEARSTPPVDNDADTADDDVYAARRTDDDNDDDDDDDTRRKLGRLENATRALGSRNRKLVQAYTSETKARLAALRRSIEAARSLGGGDGGGGGGRHPLPSIAGPLCQLADLWPPSQTRLERATSGSEDGRVRQAMGATNDARALQRRATDEVRRAFDDLRLAGAAGGSLSLGCWPRGDGDNLLMEEAWIFGQAPAPGSRWTQS